jgi:hypothetical protein
MFKKIIVVLVLGIMVLIPAVSLAKVNISWKMIGDKTGLSKQKDYDDITKIASKVVSLVLSLIAIIFFAVMMYGGLRWLTAQGEDDKIQKAQVAIKAGIIGLVIAVSSYAISNYVFDKMGFANQTSISTPVTNKCVSGGGSCQYGLKTMTGCPSGQGEIISLSSSCTEKKDGHCCKKS